MSELSGIQSSDTRGKASHDMPIDQGAVSKSLVDSTTWEEICIKSICNADVEVEIAPTPLSLMP